MKKRVYVFLDTPCESETSETSKENDGGLLFAEVTDDKSGVMLVIEGNNLKELAARTARAIVSAKQLTGAAELSS